MIRTYSEQLDSNSYTAKQLMTILIQCTIITLLHMLQETIQLAYETLCTIVLLYIIVRDSETT